MQNPPEQCDNGTNAAIYGGLTRSAAPAACSPYCGNGVVSNGEACDEGAANGSGYGHCSSRAPSARAAATASSRRERRAVRRRHRQRVERRQVQRRLHAQVRRRRPRARRAVRQRRGRQHRRLRQVQPRLHARPPLRRRHQERHRAVRRRQERRQLRHLQPQLHARRLLRRRHAAEPARDLRPGRGQQRHGLRQGPVHQPVQAGAVLRRQGRRGPVRRDLRQRRQQRPPRLLHPRLQDVRRHRELRQRQARPRRAVRRRANNGTLADKCDVHCHFKCGNGIKDPGEQCDDGVNSGAYGTCNPNCTLPGYCGDGIKNGPEQCDDGSANVSTATAYGPGVCTTSCTFAPYCGDGRTETQFGEQCDGQSNCNSMCKLQTAQ